MTLSLHQALFLKELLQYQYLHQFYVQWIQFPFVHTTATQVHYSLCSKEDHPDENLSFYKPKAAIIKQVKAAYNQQSKGSTISLNAIYSKLAGKVSYDDIKLAVAFF